METYQEVFTLFLMGLLAILALVFTMSASVVLVGASTKAWRVFVSIDRQLESFGKTDSGVYLNRQLSKLLPYVDSPDDKVVQAAIKLPILKELYKAKMIDAEAISKVLSDALGLAVALSDGKAIEASKYPPEDLG